MFDLDLVNFVLDDNFSFFPSVLRLLLYLDSIIGTDSDDESSLLLSYNLASFRLVFDSFRLIVIS